MSGLDPLIQWKMTLSSDRFRPVGDIRVEWIDDLKTNHFDDWSTDLPVRSPSHYRYLFYVRASFWL